MINYSFVIDDRRNASEATWASVLAREAALLRQGADCAASADVFKDPSVAVYHRGPASMGQMRYKSTQRANEIGHLLKASLSLPTGNIDHYQSDSMSSDSQSDDDVSFALTPKWRSFDGVHVSDSGVEVATLATWSLPEDRLLLSIDESCNDFFEGYVQAQQMFPRLFPKNMSSRKHKSADSTSAFVRDCVEIADPSAGRTSKNIRASFQDTIHHENSDIVDMFRDRVKFLKTQAVDRANILSALPSSPEVFIRSSEVPPPQVRVTRTRGPVEDQADALRAAMGGDFSRVKVLSKSLQDIADHLPLADMRIIGGRLSHEVKCSQHMILNSSPVLKEMFNEETCCVSIDRSVEVIPEWETLFSTDIFTKYVSFCQFPQLFDVFREAKNKLLADELSHSRTYSSYCESVKKRHNDRVHAEQSYGTRRRKRIIRSFASMLRKDVNQLRKMYRLHLRKELKKVDEEMSLRIDTYNASFDEEMGYLSAAQDHFMPPELAAGRVRCQVLERVVESLGVFSAHTAELLRLCEVLRSSDISSRLIQGLAEHFDISDSNSREVATVLNQPSVPRSLVCEFLTYLSDHKLFTLRRVAAVERPRSPLEVIPDESSDEEPSDRKATFPTIEETLSVALPRARTEKEYICEQPVQNTSMPGPWTFADVEIAAEFLNRERTLRQYLKTVSVDTIPEFISKKSERTDWTLWEHLLNERLTEKTCSTLTFTSNSSKAQIVEVSAHRYGISVCQNIQPTSFSFDAAFRVGEASRAVFYECNINSASSNYPHIIQIGFDVVPHCMTSPQLKIFNSRARVFNEPSEVPDSFTGRVVNSAAKGESALFVGGCGWNSDGILQIEGRTIATNVAFGNGDTVGVILDTLEGFVTFFKNGDRVAFTSYSSEGPPRSFSPRVPLLVAYRPTIIVASSAGDALAETGTHNGMNDVALSIVNRPQSALSLESANVRNSVSLAANFTGPFSSSSSREYASTTNRHFAGVAEASQM